MDVSRRQLVALGAAGAAGAAVTLVAGPAPNAKAQGEFGGVHIYATGNGKAANAAPPESPDVQHTFIITLWGPDSALSGMGCGFTDRTPDEPPQPAQVRSDYILGTGLVGCVYSATGKVEGDVVKGKAIMMYSGMPDEKTGQPFPFEANLSTGFFTATDMNIGMGTDITLTGAGVVARI